MIKFVIGLIVGGSLGFLWSGLFRAGGDDADEERREHPKQRTFGASADYAFVTINKGKPRRKGEDETVAVVPLKDMMRIMEDHTAFKPRKDFLPGCPHVCANCIHWKHELFAWGAVDFCDVAYRNREAGTICDAIVRGKHE